MIKPRDIVAMFLNPLIEAIREHADRTAQHCNALIWGRPPSHEGKGEDYTRSWWHCSQPRGHHGNCYCQLQGERIEYDPSITPGEQPDA